MGGNLNLVVVAAMMRINPHAFRCAPVSVALSLVFWLGRTANAQQVPAAPHVEVRLVSEQAGIRPGETFWVGLDFRLEKGWHVYWINPGDSGEPPNVKWDLPQGFRAGDLRWPCPERIAVSSLVNCGYTDGVTLLAPMGAPNNIPAGHSVSLRARVRWLVCREICVPGKTRVELTLPVGATKAASEPPTRALFEQTRRRLPKPAPPGWQTRVRSSGDELVFQVRTGKSGVPAEFFPLDVGLIEDSIPQSVRATPQGMEFRLKKSGQSAKPAARLRGVIAFRSGAAYQVDAPLEY